jgi:hypothetical protein
MHLKTVGILNWLRRSGQLLRRIGKKNAMSAPRCSNQHDAYKTAFAGSSATRHKKAPKLPQRRGQQCPRRAVTKPGHV